MDKHQNKIFGYDELIVFDTETTGFEPDKCELIEIAAARFKSGEIVERLDLLVHPEREIPLTIQKITHITPDMVRNAPSERKALERFVEFIGDLPLVAHNADFDMGFVDYRLKVQGLPQLSNRSFDTLPMAQFLYPRSLNHQLGTLISLFGLKLEQAHRAFADVDALVAVMEKLWQKMLSLEMGVLSQLNTFLRFSAGRGVGEALEAAVVIRNSGYQAKPPYTDPTKLVSLKNTLGECSDKSIEFDVNEVLSYLKDGSPLENVLESFSHRDVQIDMACEVAKAFMSDEYLIAEAGTGIGKSFAYLVPSLFWSAASGERVIVSTKTKNLQEQLFLKDLPAIRKALPFDFKAVLLKGRGNYLCRWRYERYIANPTLLSLAEQESFSKLIIWEDETESGDIVENSAFHMREGARLWSKVAADSHSCSGRRCPFYSDCYLYAVRESAQKANIVVVNHPLLFSDVENNAILGEYNYCIVDEAHNLERVAADHFGDMLSIWRLIAPMDTLIQPFPQKGGALNQLIEWTLKDSGEVPQSVVEGAENLQLSIREIRKLVDSFFADLAAAMERQWHWKGASYSVQERYDAKTPAFMMIKNEGELLAEKVLELTDEIAVFLGEFPTEPPPRLATILSEIEGASLKLQETCSVMTHLLNPEDTENEVLWMESPRKEDSTDARLCYAPLDVAELMRERFLLQKRSVVLTSATLSVAGDFSYLKGRLGLDTLPDERVREIILGSPFDYATQLKVFVPMFLPLPNSRDFTESLSKLLRNISLKLRKGTLVLFTSRAMLNDVFYKVQRPLESEGVSVLGQGISGSRSGVTRAFTEERESVLLGTVSFWEGVDVPGDALQILLLTKLPFAVPSEPYTAAQMDRITRAGGNNFMEYSVPEAVIRFRQGLGRLIRSESDIGALLILDRRVVEKSYGKMFIDSAPIAAVPVHSLKELVGHLRRHLD